jgi:hypothetical protein
MNHWHLSTIPEDQKLRIHHCEYLTILGYIRKENGRYRRIKDSRKVIGTYEREIIYEMQ